MNLSHLRGRMPLIAFILLAVVCLAMLGFACACLSDQPIQSIDRALSAGPALPAVIEIWSWLFVSLAGASLVLVARDRTCSRASPALLQRFLF